MRDQRFTFLCTVQERNILRAISEKLKRSQGDTVRILIYRAADEIGIENIPNENCIDHPLIDLHEQCDKSELDPPVTIG